MELRKNSYVKVDRIYGVGWGWLGPYDDSGREFAVEREGMEMVEDLIYVRGRGIEWGRHVGGRAGDGDGEGNGVL